QYGKKVDKVSKHIDESNRKYREQGGSMRSKNSNGRSPKTFNEIYAENKKHQRSVDEIYADNVRRQREREEEQKRSEQLWLENKRRREAFYSPYSKAGARFSQDTVDTLEAHVQDIHDTASRHASELKSKANDLSELWRNENQGSAYS